MTSPSGVEVDIMGATESLYLDAIEDSSARNFLGQSVLVPRPEMYVLLKLRAAEDVPADRLKHMSDALRVFQVLSNVDLESIGRYIDRSEQDLLPMYQQLLNHIVAARLPPKKPKKK
jgi:hypothetical protein